jgi:hypothetical protein
MRIRLSHPELASDLLEHLQQRPDVVGARVSESELEVSIRGSRRELGLQRELESLLRTWKVSHEHVEIELTDTLARGGKGRMGQGTSGHTTQL